MLTIAELLDDLTNVADRNGKSHALHGVVGIFCGIDRNHLTVLVEKRAAAVAGIDRRIRLDQRIGNVIDGDLTVQSADVADCHGLSIPESVADRDCHLPDSHVVGISDPRDADGVRRLIRKLRERNRNNREIRRSSLALDHCLRLRLIAKYDLDAVRVRHHMVVRDDQHLTGVLSDDDAGTASAQLLGGGTLFTPEIVHGTRRVAVDRYYRGHHTVSHKGDIRRRHRRGTVLTEFSGLRELDCLRRCKLAPLLLVGRVSIRLLRRIRLLCVLLAEVFFQRKIRAACDHTHQDRQQH